MVGSAAIDKGKALRWLDTELFMRQKEETTQRREVGRPGGTRTVLLVVRHSGCFYDI